MLVSMPKPPMTLASDPIAPQPELSLADSEQQFRRLFEAAQDGILFVDRDSGAIVDANPFLLSLLDYSRVEVVGRHLWEIGLLGDESASRAAFRDLQEKGYVRY